MYSKAGIDNGIRLLKAVPKIKFKTEAIGYKHTDGKISFASQDAAIKYAKNRVVKALNCNKPFERGLILNDNVVCAEFNGSSKEVLIPIEDSACRDFITVHGHPDAVKLNKGEHPCLLRNILNGNIFKNKERNHYNIAYPTSLSDYRTFMLDPKERKSIVYNSKGEYSILTKNKSGISMNHQDFNQIANEYYMTVPEVNFFVDSFIELYKSFQRFFQTTQKAEQSIIKDADNLSKKIHDFLLHNTDQYGVTYETNFSNLIKIN